MCPQAVPTCGWAQMGMELGLAWTQARPHVGSLLRSFSFSLFLP